MTVITEQVGQAGRICTGAIESRDVAWTLPGLGPMTRVTTSFGEVHAQALRERDMVRSMNGHLSEIVEIDRLRLDAAFLAQVPDAYPVMIRAGALGAGLPKADILVSPGQNIGFGRNASDAHVVRAGDLVGRPGIVRRPEEMMTYTNFRCSQPVVVEIEGVWAEVA